MTLEHDLPIREKNRKCSRDRLRDIYTNKLPLLVHALDSRPQAAYSGNELKSLGVILEHFDPDDQEFIASESCLFKPMSLELRREFIFIDPGLEDGGTPGYSQFDDLFVDPMTDEKSGSSDKKSDSSATLMKYNSMTVFNLLNLFYECSIRGSTPVEENPDGFLCQYSHWHNLKEDTTFWNGPYGLIVGRSRPGISRWWAAGVREWQRDYDDAETICPHLVAILCIGSEAEGELLFAELGAIAQGMQRRLDQEEFKKTSLFPVLVISLFGPRHGRLLQARLTKSGILKVRASPIHSFEKRESAPWDLYLRYLACEPNNGPEYEIYSDDEKEEEKPTTQDDAEQVPSSGASIEVPRMNLIS